MSSPKAPQTPYLGSRISLISKAEIRYEGILYTVDTTEQTIALAKVKSYGTENRPTDNPVPARDEVFEYIIFKATDIKDLIVRETPKPVPTLAGGLPYDPAIVSVSQHPATGSRSGTPAQVAQSASSLHAANALRSPTAEGAQPNAASKGFGAGPMGHQGHNQPFNRARSPGRGGGGGGFGFTNGQRGAWGAYNRGAGYRGGYLAAMGGGAVSYRQAAMAAQRGGGPMGHNVPGGAPGPQGFRGGWRGAFYPPRGMPFRGHRGNMAMHGGRPQQQQTRFDSEYDFEKANEQFQETLKIADGDTDKQKTKIEDGVKSGDSEKAASPGGDKMTAGGDAAAVAPAVGPDDVVYYDKAKSFFDRISCEALEREQPASNAEPFANNRQRVNWRREREINAETFGPQALRSYFVRRGGMGGPMRGGGGFYRGQRGFYRGAPFRGGSGRY